MTKRLIFKSQITQEARLENTQSKHNIQFLKADDEDRQLKGLFVAEFKFCYRRPINHRSTCLKSQFRPKKIWLWYEMR